MKYFFIFGASSLFSEEKRVIGFQIWVTRFLRPIHFRHIFRELINVIVMKF